MNTPDICRAILNVLAATDGWPLDEDLLHEHARSKGHHTRAVFDAALKLLDEQGYATSKPGEFGGPSKWMITEKGDAYRRSR